MAEEKEIGVFELGWENVKLVGIEGFGGSFSAFDRESKSLPIIKIGLDSESWKEVVETLLHETLEFVLFRKDLRFNPSQGTCYDHARYLFVMDHTEFSESCSRSAEFISKALPKLKKVWKKWKAGKK